MNLITIEPGALPEYLTPGKLEAMPLRELLRVVYENGCEFEGLYIKRREYPGNVIVPEQWRNGGGI